MKEMRVSISKGVYTKHVRYKIKFNINTECDQALKTAASGNEVKAWLFMYMLMIIMTAKTTEGVKSYCVSSAVLIGSKATVTCHFDADLSHLKQKVYVEHLELNGDTVEAVVVCQWSLVNHTCSTSLGYNVIGNVSMQLSVEIPKALKEHSGEYWCDIYKSESTGFQRCHLRVTTPSRVTSLTVDGHSNHNHNSAIVLWNQSVSVVCSWENGDPPSTVRLLGSNGKRLLKISDISGNVGYQFSAVSCNDTGNVYCEAAGSEKNLSATLLVACPPTFTSSDPVFHAESMNHTVKIDFPLRIHSMHITKCQLIHYAEDFNLNNETDDMQTYVNYPCDMKYVNNSGNIGKSVPRPRPLKCNCHLNGTLPNLIISIHIFNVTIGNSKRWRLIVSNSEGNGKIDFYLYLERADAYITSLSIGEFEGEGPHLLLRNRSVRINCSWENVYPPSIVRLLDNTGNVLLYSKNDRGNMAYTISAVTCQDAGMFACNAQGSKKNRSVTLLVECPPVFVNSSYETTLMDVMQDIVFNFSIRMHSPFIKTCRVSKFTSKMTEPEGTHVHNIYITYMCTIPSLVTATPDHLNQGSSCQCTVTGTAPDLVLHLLMFNVNMSDNGRWCVTLFNSVGSANVDFFLHSIGETITENGNNILIISIIVGSSAFVCIIVIIVGMCTRFRAGHKKCDESMRREIPNITAREAICLHADYTLEQLQDAVSTYEDIQDIEENKGSEASSLRKSHVHHIHANQADQYLQPATIGILETCIQSDYIIPVTISTSMRNSGTANSIPAT